MWEEFWDKHFGVGVVIIIVLVIIVGFLSIDWMIRRDCEIKAEYKSDATHTYVYPGFPSNCLYVERPVGQPR